MKLLSFLLPLLGLVRGAKNLTIDTNTTQAEPIQSPVMVPSAPIPEQPVLAERQANTEILPVEVLLDEDHHKDGEINGYKSHSNDGFELGIAAKAARFKAEVKKSMDQLEAKILQQEEDLIDAGPVQSGRVAKINARISFQTKRLAYWTVQYSLQLVPTTDPTSEFNKIRDEYRHGFDEGWQKFEQHKRLGEANGLTGIF